PSKPRVLIADDSRIVRATLIKHIQGMFEFREALDGEQAWETLLIDPSIRVVITDLTMPKLDGYGLLTRIRGSEISRIRDLPVVVVSGSDEREERDRAMAAGATDLITKGIGTAQLLSRLDILSKLVNTQREFERSLEVLVRNRSTTNEVALASTQVLQEQSEAMLSNAIQQSKNFFILHICVGFRHSALAGSPMRPPSTVVSAIGQLLQRTIRQTDSVAQTGRAEFTLATGSVTFDSAHNFAQRLCNAIANANLVRDDRMTFIACCGLASLSEQNVNETPISSKLGLLREIAHRRAIYGLNHAITGVIGLEEESAIKNNGGVALTTKFTSPVTEQESPITKRDSDGMTLLPASSDIPDPNAAPPELATLLQWIKEGKQDQVMQHIGKLSAELQPLVDLMLRQSKH
ncbi:MAG: response regulator, partial [Burkholderiaceae bacterium]